MFEGCVNEDDKRWRGASERRPVKASNGQYWRAEKASIVISNFYPLTKVTQ
jgi:hypothetical protein